MTTTTPPEQSRANIAAIGAGIGGRILLLGGRGRAQLDAFVESHRYTGADPTVALAGAEALVGALRDSASRRETATPAQRAPYLKGRELVLLDDELSPRGYQPGLGCETLARVIAYADDEGLGGAEGAVVRRTFSAVLGLDITTLPRPGEGEPTYSRY